MGPRSGARYDARMSAARVSPIDQFLRAVDGLSRPAKRMLMAGWDGAVASGALWLAFCLRLGTSDLPPEVSWRVLALPALVAPPVFAAFGLYREITRYVGPRFAIAAGCCLMWGCGTPCLLPRVGSRCFLWCRSAQL